MNIEISNDPTINHIVIGMIYRASEDLQTKMEMESDTNNEVYVASKLYNHQAAHHFYSEKPKLFC
jgi:hypothetical protein